MPYLVSSDRVSTRALYSCDDYIAHSISWGKHRYVRREGTAGKYRYIYPEDLKAAGSRLVTGAKNLASRAASTASSAYKSARTTARNATQTAARAIGVPQAREYHRAYNSRLTASGNVTAAKDPIKTPRLGSKNDPRRSRAIARASEIERRASDRTYRAYQQYRGTFAEAADDARDALRSVSQDTVRAVASFMKSKIGVGGKKKVLLASGRYSAAMRKADQVNYNYNHDGSTSLADLRSANEAANEAWNDYYNACVDYGKTFLGHFSSSLWTVPTRITNQGGTINETIIPETILHETIIPEKKITERRG